ncbi:MAG: LPP20 family lipoprotein [Thermodesulfobacteriota bacterium]|nr:LPP20 family lipoprotein [Thermodesulfobacteriota bacterium]
MKGQTIQNTGDGKMKWKMSMWAVLAAAVIMVTITGCRCLWCSHHKGKSSFDYQSVLEKNNSENKVVVFRVTGKGLAPETATFKGQAMIMAEKAAVADGYRMLAEKLRGVYIDAYMKTSNGTVNYDVVETQTHTWLRGAKIVDIVRSDFGITEAYMNLRVRFKKKDMIWWPAGISDGSSFQSGTGRHSHLSASTPELSGHTSSLP